ncbi:Transposase [Planctomycetes bacterium Poly30]|uniref:Transposase n=1 Tax=Saltatorellus ferox TaxID=2528018 RepID=A0A518ET24_9BACT|nr:Transposase [Planctomycetes bacterium Poly30]
MGGIYVPKYSNGLKARMIQRMTGPEGISANALSRSVGISQSTLSQWVRERSLDGMRDKNSKKARSRSGAEKLRIVQEAAACSEEELGAYLRREGIHSAQLDEWTGIAEAAALAGLSPQKRSKGKPSVDADVVDELRKDLRRKEKALAEVTAILVLKKRIQEIWGDGDGDTDTRSAT